MLGVTLASKGVDFICYCWLDMQNLVDQTVIFETLFSFKKSLVLPLYIMNWFPHFRHFNFAGISTPKHDL